MTDWRIHEGDALEVLRDEVAASCVQTCVTSPPYWGLRDYGIEGQIGLEPTPEEYVERLVMVFREVRRVLRDDGTLWLNLGDSYARSPEKGEKFRGKSRQFLQHNANGLSGPSVPEHLKPKDLVGTPWRVAFALQADGWYLRSDIIWAKPNPMPESVTDRPTKAHEYLFLLAKRERYYYDAEAIREPARPESASRYAYGFKDKKSGTTKGMRECGEHQPRGDSVPIVSLDQNPLGRNRRTVWTIPTQPFAAAHFAVFPPALVEPCILAGAPERGVVLDPFAGSGTVGVVCRKHRRRFVGIELNPEYAQMARGRLGEDVTPEAKTKTLSLFDRSRG